MLVHMCLLGSNLNVHSKPKNSEHYEKKKWYLNLLPKVKNMLCYV